MRRTHRIPSDINTPSGTAPIDGAKVSKSPIPIIQALVRLFDDQGNTVGDFNQIQSAVNEAYETLSAYSLIKSGREMVALEIWHRFADSGTEEWADETHKAEYLLCADAILTLSSLRQTERIQNERSHQDLRSLR